MEHPRIEAAGKDVQFFAGDPPVDPAFSVVLGIHVDHVQLAVEPVHEIPREGFHERIVGEDPDILREVGVVDPDRAEPEGFRGRERAEPGRARRADDDLGEPAAFEVVKNLEDRRKTQPLELILGQLEFPDRLEIFERDPVVGNF